MISIKTLKTMISDGSFDQKLSHLYVRPVSELGYYKDRIIRLAENYASVFVKDDAAQVAICTAAGRTEIGGNHTDHQRGRVLTGSVDLDALACAAPNCSKVITLYSEGFGETRVDISDLTPVKEEINTTASLIRGIAAAYAARGYEVAGFDAYVVSDVPGGSGLSSSACIEVLLGTVMNHLFAKDALSMVEIAKIGQYAENVFFGKPSGLMDQMGCAVGGIVTIDFADKENPVYHAVDVDFSKAGYALCVIDSGADHADLTADYSAIPAEMRAAAAVFGKEVLSEVPAEEFFANVKKVREIAGDRAVLRGFHYYEDCKKVEKQVKALEEGDFDTFLSLIKDSGRSSFCYLQNVSTFREADGQPVAYALMAAEAALNGKGAVRVHGGGFAGTIQAFVPMDEVESFTKKMDAALKEGACRVTFIRPIGGCVLMS